MTEVNVRWERDHKQLTTLGTYFPILSVAMWAVSYYASFPAAQEGQGRWFAALSIFTLLAAMGTSIASAVMWGIAMTDKKPLPGSN